MHLLKKLPGLYTSVLLVIVLAGCVAPLPPRPSSDFTYHPKARPGIATVEAAKNDLALMLKDLKDTPVGVVRDEKQKPYRVANEGELHSILEEYKRKGGKVDMRLNPQTYGLEAFTIWYLNIEAFPVSDDGIEVPLNPPLLFSDLLNDKLVVTVGSHEYHGAYCYEINFANRYALVFGPRDLAGAQRFVDNLFVIQEHLKKQEQEQAALFAEQVANYHALAVKPVVSETQRKLFVQANALSQQKDYPAALEFYNKALEIDPLSYPNAYFNMALLEAQLNRFHSAIASMKKYLTLEPDAGDARSAQDKIYEWELMISKPK